MFHLTDHAKINTYEVELVITGLFYLSLYCGTILRNRWQSAALETLLYEFHLSNCGLIQCGALLFSLNEVETHE